MEVKEILDTLNEYYKTKPYIGLDDDNSGSPSLNKMENCAYFGILKSLSNAELYEAEEIVSEGSYAPIIEFFIQNSSDTVRSAVNIGNHIRLQAFDKYACSACVNY